MAGMMKNQVTDRPTVYLTLTILEVLEGIGIPSQITLRVAQVAVGIGHLQIVITQLRPPHP